MTFDILVPGDAFCDVIFTGLPELPALGREIYAKSMQFVPGGGAINTVVGLHRLGVKAGWIGALGDDFSNRFVLDWLTNEGIDLSLVEHRNTPLVRLTVAMSFPTDRAFVTYVDPLPDIVALTIAAMERTTPRHLHFAGLTVDERLIPMLDAWKSQGVTLSMDCQTRPHTLDTPLVRETLQRLDFFMPNTAEAMRLTGKSTRDEAAAALIEHVSRLVLKDGANGAYLWDKTLSDKVSVLHTPAISITPLDTTGAGDMFNAGFLTAFLAGQDGETCLKWGNICGGLSTQGYGGALNAPTWETVQAALRGQ